MRCLRKLISFRLIVIGHLVAEAKFHSPALRFAAIFSAETTAIEWACQRAVDKWGPPAMQSEDFQFDSTEYYAASMGSALFKRLIAFRRLIDPTDLVRSKQQSNNWELEYKTSFESRVERPINIDPGYLTEAKVVLATMKDRDHRLYLGEGVYGEVTLYYQLPGDWVASRWTYPDYRIDGYHKFFTRCREYLRNCLQKRSPIS